MRTKDNETRIARVLPPKDYPSPVVKPTFDWRVDLSPEIRLIVTQAVDDVVGPGSVLTDSPETVIVSRSGVGDDVIQADLRDSSGMRIAVVRFEEHGWGRAHFTRS